MDERVVVDASVWISRLTPQDVNYSASSLWATHFTSKGGLLVVPKFLLIEVAGAISRLTGDSAVAKKIVANISKDKAMNFVSLNSMLVKNAIDIAATFKLRGSDAIYVALAHQRNIPLVSWDKEQLKRASSVLTATHTPDAYPFEEDTEEAEENDKS